MRDVLETLREEGFNVASVSGGEPLLYPHLYELLEFARSLSMTVTVTTNGMLLTQAKLDRLTSCADLIAISLDGIPESHDRMRSHPGAFAKMAEKLELVRVAKIPFGLIFTLTLYNLNELAWVANFAVEQGARLLQVHPLEEEGRAGEDLPGAAPDELELAHAFVEVARLQTAFSGKLVIQFDAADRETLAHDPSRGFAMPPFDNADQLSLSSLVAPLVLEHDGAILPLQYGVGRDYKIADALVPGLKAQIERWKSEGYPRFLELCAQVYEDSINSTGHRYPFFNWYSAILRASHKHDLVALG
jgi:MoaA/NifB/PqqE/SkfB family radical SAM enzyme